MVRPADNKQQGEGKGTAARKRCYCGADQKVKDAQHDVYPELEDALFPRFMPLEEGGILTGGIEGVVDDEGEARYVSYVFCGNNHC